ncbi:MAG: TonB family protein [Lysobacteraceae bacterium]
MTTELLAWLINATVATSLAGVAVMLLRKPLQRLLGAEIAYRLWIVLPLATLAACFSLPHAAPVATTNASMTTAITPMIVMRASNAMTGLDADRWLLAVWLCGACGLIVVLVWQQRRFVARLRLRQNGDGSWRSAVTDAAPAVLGVLRQKLVLPDRFETDYDADEQQLIITHERMHQQRRDPWALAFCAALRALFWFNPIVHVAVVRFRRDVELACDAAVLRAHPGSRQRYATALLKAHIAEDALPVGCLWENTPPMKERIMLLKRKLPTRPARLAGAILIAIASLGAAGFAVAGHDSALYAATALAAPPPAPPAPPTPPTMADMPAPPASPTPPTMANMPAPPALDDLHISPPPPTPPVPPPPHGLHHPRAALAPLPPPQPAPADAPPAAPAPPATLAAGNAPASFKTLTQPHYPKAAVDGKIGGKVQLKLLVGADGSVKHIEVASSQPAGLFDQMSIDAAKKWHFNPATNAKGQPVAGYVMVPVTFSPDQASAL